jgi:transcription initiation factor TFIID subunit 6
MMISAGIRIDKIAHWLAVEGVQPRIVENPTPSDLTDKSLPTTSTPLLSNSSEGLNGAPSVKSVLTRELEIYFEKITASLESEDESICGLAIESVSTDPGIQGLLPYFVQFIADMVHSIIIY